MRGDVELCAFALPGAHVSTHRRKQRKGENSNGGRRCRGPHSSALDRLVLALVLVLLVHEAVLVLAARLLARLRGGRGTRDKGDGEQARRQRGGTRKLNPGEGRREN